MDVINCRGNLVHLDTPKVMGILNVTPDSFYDGNQFLLVDKAIEKVAKMVEQGADIVDIGGASSRPGAKLIDAETEWKRIEGVLDEIVKQFPTLVLSIDTYWSKVAEKAYHKGVSIINDISGFDEDPRLVDVVAETGMPYILMHMRGNPRNMQLNPNYQNVVDDLLKYFIRKIRTLESKGIKDIIIDPGFGFGKTLDHNYEMLRKLNVFRLLEKPIMVGISRKSMIYKFLDIDPKDSLPASSALHLQALLNGANLVRTHDVLEAKQMISLFLMLNERTISFRS